MQVRLGAVVTRTLYRSATLWLMVATFGMILPSVLWAQGQAFLENPGPSSFQSGIGFIAGWKCQAAAQSLSTLQGHLSTRLPGGHLPGSASRWQVLARQL